MQASSSANTQEQGAKLNPEPTRISSPTVEANQRHEEEPNPASPAKPSHQRRERVNPFDISHSTGRNWTLDSSETRTVGGELNDDLKDPDFLRMGNEAGTSISTVN
jgi:hypothetical protein